MYRKPVFTLAAVILALLVASSAWAGTTGKIAGIVLDRDSGEPLPGVSILIKGTTTGAATNIQGEFFIINVPPGNYNLRVTLVGYGPVEVEKVRVSIDLTTTVDLELSTQTIDMGTITVEAVRPLIEKDITSSRILVAPIHITGSAVDGLVNAVNFTAGWVLGSMRGGRKNQGEVIYMLDGVNVGNPIGESHRGTNPGQGNSALATIIPNEAVAEAEVLTGGFGAEYPNVQSAIINVVTRSGGDKYAGKIKSKSSPEVIFGRDNMEDDTFHLDWAAPGSTVVVRRAKVDDKNRSDFYDMRQHEFSFGGPVPIEKFDIPGKLSFFTSGIYNYRRSYEDLRGWNKSGSVLGKLTYEISSWMKLTISGLKSTGSSSAWARHHLLTDLTWGEPVYYHRNDVDLATDEVVVVDTFFTPYSWIMAPNHSEGDISQDLMSYWWSQYSDGTWDSSDSSGAVEDYFETNFGGATYHQWAEIPDSVREGAAQYI
ncbi:MAG: carboxypeptidase-like regulatory domain-containing protein, partial [candidate division Zixibacteria bacterium]